MLIILHSWHRGAQNLLLVMPVPLLEQWRLLIENRFSIPLFALDGEAAFSARASEAATPSSRTVL